MLRTAALLRLRAAAVAAAFTPFACSPSNPGDSDSGKPATATAVEKLVAGDLVVKLRDESPSEAGHVRPRIVIENGGAAPIRDFTVRYYFTVDPGKVPVLEDWYTPSCTTRLEQVAGTTYALVYDFGGFTLNPGQVVPDAAGSVVGLHHSDWSVWKRNDDWSYQGVTATFAPTSRVVVRDGDGDVVYGTGPFGEAPSANSRAVALDGAGDYVRFDGEAAFDLGTRDFTLAAWVRIPSEAPATGSYTIAAKNRAGITPGSNPGYRLAWSNDQTRIHVDNGTTRFSAGAGGVLQRNRWHHVAGIRNGGELALYVDGLLVDTEALPSGFDVDNDRPFAIGASVATSAERFFRGALDNVALFERALSRVDLRALADYGANVYDRSLVGYWAFDAGDARDSGTRENDGAFQGHAAPAASPLGDDTELESDSVAGFEYTEGWTSAGLALSSAPPFRGTASLRLTGSAGSIVTTRALPVEGGDAVSFMVKLEGAPPPTSRTNEVRLYYGTAESGVADQLFGSVVLDASYLDAWQEVTLPLGDLEEAELLRRLEELLWRMERIPDVSWNPELLVDRFRPLWAGPPTFNPCPNGYDFCAGECVELDSNDEHCGACGNACTGSERCCDGGCYLWERVVGEGPPLASVGVCGLQYRRYANQYQTNLDHILPDFSFAGYQRGGVPLPHARVREIVSPGSGDDGARIQAAIDRVSARPRDEYGFRGAVLLKRGRYQLGELFTSEGSTMCNPRRHALRIAKSGVVLRGEGQGSEGTILEATAPEEHSLLLIEGSGNGFTEVSGTRTSITSDIVPVGTRRFEVASAAAFAKGDTIVVLRTPNQSWVDAIGMDRDSFPDPCPEDPPDDGDSCSETDCSVPWTPESYAIGHPRRVVAVNGNELTIDIPIVDAIEDQFGGGEVYLTDTNDGHIRQTGVERVRMESNFDGPEDENHGWTAVHLRRVHHSWVKKLTAVHFGLSAVRMESDSNFNTVEEVAHLDPISQAEGGRRYPLYVQDGIGNLIQRSFTRQGRHSFVTSSRVTGPNVWLDCLATETRADDGPHHRWATGLLFDNISTNELFVQNRLDFGSGHGWAGAQVMFWNIAVDSANSHNGNAASVVSDAPHGAMNWIVGSNVEPDGSSKTPDEDAGIQEAIGSVATPRSLYLQQLRDRLGTTGVDAITTPEQRAGRIWNELAEWAGEGELFPDPTCDDGLEHSTGACCAASCGTCGGNGCSRREGATDSCCVGTIQASNRSCLEYGPPCLLPDPTCSRGIQNGSACCKESCEACGGDKCSDREGGAAGCCVGPITEAARSCDEFPPPCVVGG